MPQLSDDSLRCATYLRIAYLLYDGPESVQYAQQALEIARATDQRNQMGLAYHRLAWCLGYEEMDQKTAYLDSAEQVFLTIGDLNGLGRVLDTKGVLLINYGSTEDAQDAFAQAYNYYDQLGNEERKAGVLNNWAISLYESGWQEEAIAKYHQALDYRLQEQPENSIEIARLYHGLGECSRLQGELEQATIHQIASFHYRQKIRDRAIIENLIIIANMAYEAAEQGQDTSGIYRQIHAWGFAGTTALLDSAEQVSGLSESTGLQLYLKNAWRKWYLLRGNYEAAYQLIDEIKTIEEEGKLSASSLEAMADLKVKYDRERLQRELLEEEISNQKKATQVNLLFLSLGILLLALLIVFLIYQNRLKANRLLLTAAKQEQQLIAINSMLEGQEKERARIARDLHDGLGNLLATIKANLGNLGQQSLDRTTPTPYTKTSEMVDEACIEVRKIAHEMMPRSLEKLGLPQALTDLIHRMDETHAFSASIAIYGQEQSLSDGVNIMLYRIVQEALNNVVKYAQATEVDLQMTYAEEWLNITIEDDGVGFDPKRIGPDEGLGLNSIAFRTQYIGGNFEIDSRPGMGTMISINVSLKEAA